MNTLKHTLQSLLLLLLIPTTLKATMMREEKKIGKSSISSSTKKFDGMNLYIATPDFSKEKTPYFFPYVLNGPSYFLEDPAWSNYINFLTSKNNRDDKKYKCEKYFFTLMIKLFKAWNQYRNTKALKFICKSHWKKYKNNKEVYGDEPLTLSSIIDYVTNDDLNLISFTKLKKSDYLFSYDRKLVKKNYCKYNDIRIKPLYCITDDVYQDLSSRKDFKKELKGYTTYQPNNKYAQVNTKELSRDERINCFKGFQILLFKCGFPLYCAAEKFVIASPAHIKMIFYIGLRVSTNQLFIKPSLYIMDRERNIVTDKKVIADFLDMRYPNIKLTNNEKNTVQEYIKNLEYQRRLINPKGTKIESYGDDGLKDLYS